MERSLHLPLPVPLPQMEYCHCPSLPVSSDSPPLRAADEDSSTKAPRPAVVVDFRTGMAVEGMQNLDNPPTDRELRLYYATCAPAHKSIQQMRYTSAAAEYRRLAEASKDAGLQARYETIVRQLKFCGQMKAAGVSPMTFPPSAAEVHKYFSLLRQQPLSEIQSAFQEYTDAFYVHVETKGVARRDVCYSAGGESVSQQKWRSRVPTNWSELNSSRDLHIDGRRIIDSAGYAYLGQRCLIAAGFTEGLFAAITRTDNAITIKQESRFAHLMFAARRTMPEDGGAQRRKHTEVVVVSNQRLYWAIVDPPQDVETVELTTLRFAHQTAYGTSAQDSHRHNVLVLHREAWQALERLSLQNPKRP